MGLPKSFCRWKLSKLIIYVFTRYNVQIMPKCYLLWEPEMCGHWGSTLIGLFRTRQAAIEKASTLVNQDHSEFVSKTEALKAGSCPPGENMTYLEKALSKGGRLSIYSVDDDLATAYKIAIEELEYEGPEQDTVYFLEDDSCFDSSGGVYHVFATEEQMLDYIIYRMSFFEPSISNDEIQNLCRDAEIQRGYIYVDEVMKVFSPHEYLQKKWDSDAWDGGFKDARVSRFEYGQMRVN